MRAVVQRVLNSSVKIEGKIVSEIKTGLLVLLGVTSSDIEEDLVYMRDKIPNLRIFEDENEKMNLSLKDVEGEILLVSQFTLYGDARKGRRPSFTNAASPDMAEKLYEQLKKEWENMGIRVRTGKFGADMKVSLVNDGPVTILLDSSRSF